MKIVFRIFLLIGVAVCFFVTASASAAVSVYGTGTYSGNDLSVVIYANIDSEDELRSFGIKLHDNRGNLEVTGATRNNDVWYLGIDNPYAAPDTSVAGEVTIIGGKLDIENPGDGVSGQGVLLGEVKFVRTSAAQPDITLDFGKNGDYNNFVAINGNVLDQSFSMGLVTVEEGDFDADGLLDSIEDKNQDGIVNQGETNPENDDSDADGLTDGQEDLNKDGIKDGNETDPRIADSDGDGWDDGAEVDAGTNPLDSNNFPVSIPTVSEWGMIVFALLLMLVGGMMIRKREAA